MIVLESVLTVKTKYVKLDFISVLLNVDGAEEQRDALARTLYNGVVNWIIEQINQKVFYLIEFILNTFNLEDLQRRRRVD